MAPQQLQWKEQEPFASILKVKSAMAGGEKAIAEIVMATHAGMTTEEFEQLAKEWIATAKHPKTGKLYTEMVYQPMLELLAYLRLTALRPTSSLAAESSSCAPGPRRSTAFRLSRLSAAAEKVAGGRMNPHVIASRT